MKREYETVVIFDGSMPEETIVKEKEKLEKFFKKNSEHIKTDVWGLRELAYKIKKKDKGFYIFFVYNTDAETTEKLEKSLKLNQNVLRYMTTLYKKPSEIEKPLDKKLSVKKNDDTNNTTPAEKETDDKNKENHEIEKEEK